MSKRPTARKTDRTEVLADILVATPQEFNSDRDTFRGRYVTPKDAPVANHPYVSYGHLPHESRALVDQAEYVIYSYNTPIVVRIAGRGWVQLPHKYSSTTSQHQGRVRRALEWLRVDV
jgi:hypothetical protein